MDHGSDLRPPDTDVLRDRASQIRAILGGTTGVSENHVELQEDIAQIQVEVDLEKTQRYGLKPAMCDGPPIDGLHSVVVLEWDFADEGLVEAELAFFAQDKVGNVWRMGEYPENTRMGRSSRLRRGYRASRTPSPVSRCRPCPLWEPQATPKAGGPEVDFIDRARVEDSDLEDCVATGCYMELLRTEEFNVEEPGVVQLKYYTPDLGNIRTG